MSDPEIDAIGQPREAPGVQGIPLAKWKRLIEVFRAQGATINYREAARIAGVKPATAKANFERGTDRLKRPPIRDVLLREQVEARAAAEAATTKVEERIEALGGDAATRAAANKQATTTKAQESRLLAGARVTAEVCLAVAGKLLRTAGPLTERMSSEINALLSPGGKLDLKGANALMAMLFNYAAQATSLAKQVVDLERVLVGGPDKVIAVTGDVSTAEAVAEIVAVQRMLQRAAADDSGFDPVMREQLRRAGAFRVIKGGAA